MRELQKIVVLTGAGISAESGLATFRGAGGLWEGHRVEEVATPEAFARNPGLVHRFYNERRRRLLEVEPNEGHRALVQLEAEHGGEVVTVTQNIDDLHERAGSRHLMHMHGELLKIRCNRCQAIAGWTEDLSLDQPCADCGDAGWLRPHVVWFGEMPLQMERIYQALDRCRLFISIGTSGNVYPAAGFVAQVTNGGGTHAVELNMEPSEGATLFAEARYGPATELVPAYIDKILNGGWQAG